MKVVTLQDFPLRFQSLMLPISVWYGSVTQAMCVVLSFFCGSSGQGHYFIWKSCGSEGTNAPEHMACFAFAIYFQEFG